MTGRRYDEPKYPPKARKSEETFNVLARRPGWLHPDEPFINTAQWDHPGRGKPDSTADTIYKGAMDNAAGGVGLLELARASAAAPRTARSQLFMTTTLEKSGLLGADFKRCAIPARRHGDA